MPGFTYNPWGKTWMCNICPQPQAALSLSLAIRHEDSNRHVYHVRMKDNVENFVELHPTASSTTFDSHLHDHSTQADPRRRVWHAADGTSGALASDRPMFNVVTAADPWLETDDGAPFSAASLGTAQNQSHSVTGLDGRIGGSAAVHGPALEDDQPGQIYDNWGGCMSFNRPDEMQQEDAPLRDSEETLVDELAIPIGDAEVEQLLHEGPSFGLENMGAHDVHEIISMGTTFTMHCRRFGLTCMGDYTGEGPHYVSSHLGTESYWPWANRAVSATCSSFVTES